MVQSVVLVTLLPWYSWSRPIRTDSRSTLEDPQLNMDGSHSPLVNMLQSRRQKEAKFLRRIRSPDVEISRRQADDQEDDAPTCESENDCPSQGQVTGTYACLHECCLCTSCDRKERHVAIRKCLIAAKATEEGVKRDKLT